ncbi:non-canonical purine NTP pyrophosphatase [Corynebacterium sp. H78]|uniref:non-canonical purine NTP pyrophosphatase n=1 Tax=Corynebacterium sp. H78 TaxID=3133417 RepID=UPI0030A5C3C4
MKLLVATRNKKKLVELDRLLVAADIHGVELLSLADVAEYEERPEDGRTFADNAFIKAFDGAEATGLPCLADDSGLAVDELNGMPGVLSARWSGQHGDDMANYSLLLAQMGDVPDERRTAAFCSACVLVVPNVESSESDAEPEVISVMGQWPGRVVRGPVGDEGFGYDPVFVPLEEDERIAAGRELETLGDLPRTAAQLAPAEKDSMSHRGRALAQLVPEIAALAARMNA